MSKFEFRENKLTHQWVVIAPARSKRPNVAKGAEPECPFCAGAEGKTPKEVFRLGGGKSGKSGWQIRVVPNKYPFAPTHEIIIHSPIHDGSLFSYPTDHTAKIFRTFKARYVEHRGKGQVYIFHNHGVQAAESLPHDHSQLTVVDKEIILDIPRMGSPENIFLRSKYFSVFSPDTSQWPFEVWFAPNERGKQFGDVKDEEIKDLAKIMPRILRRMQKIIAEDFPFNFYIYHGGDWYLRVIPRIKEPGGFELGTGIFVNTVDPVVVARKLK